MFRKLSYICSIAILSSCLNALAGCPEDIKDAEKKTASALAACNAMTAKCNPITNCWGRGKTKALYARMMRASSAYTVALNQLAAVTKRCAK